MRINKLVLNNFFRFYERQEIICSIDNGRNVIILRGENGAGKTTLLNAFYWGMYGDVLPPLSIETMLNYRKADEINENETAVSSIELEFEDKGKNYFINRKQKFIKKNNKIIPFGEVKPYIYYSDPKTGNAVEVEEDFLESIIPKRLRHFFFFDGERINKLAQVDGKTEIQKAILDILGLTTIKTTKKDLNDIKAEYTRELAKNTNKDEQEFLTKKIDAETWLEVLEVALEDHKLSLEKTQESIEKVQDYLARSNSEIVRNKQSERTRLEKEVISKKNELYEIRSKITNHISKNLKTCIVSEVFDDTLSYLEEKREKGELPSDIKVQFIEDILNRGRCICGCELVKGEENYNIVETLKKIAGRTELDDAYSKITSYIKFKKSEKDFFEELNLLIKKEKQIIDNIDSFNNRIEKIGMEIQNSDHERIRYNENKRKELLSKLNDISTKIGKTENNMRNAKRDIEKYEKQIKGAKFSSILATKIQNRIEQVKKLLDLNNEIEQYFIDRTRMDLDIKIKEVFSNITRKEYRIPVLTDNFELKITSALKNENIDESEVLSTGEGQITSLSFIGALVQYSREKAKEEFLSDFAGGDFPIVMDSPFGNLDATHTANVAANIGELASQVIIVVSDKQWSKEVKENIGHQVVRMYKMYDENDTNKNVSECTVIKGEKYIG